MLTNTGMCIGYQSIHYYRCYLLISLRGKNIFQPIFIAKYDWRGGEGGLKVSLLTGCVGP
jgi:hypothetical protein